MKYFVMILCLVFLSGCASRNVWVNPSKNNTEAQKDFRECKYDSEKSSFVPYSDVISPISAGLQEGFQSVSLMNECMRSRGYNLVNRSKNDEDRMFHKNLQEEINAALEVEDYNKILELTGPTSGAPGTPDIFAYRCSAYGSLGNVKEAMKSCDNAMKYYGNTSVVINARAVVLADFGEPEIGLELLNIAITNESKSSVLYNNRAYILNKMLKFDKAIEDCNKSIALDSSSCAPYKNRGNSFIGLKDYDNAIKSFNKSISINDKYGKAYFGRGEAYALLNINEKANEDFKKACSLNYKIACDKVSLK